MWRLQWGHLPLLSSAPCLVTDDVELFAMSHLLDDATTVAVEPLVLTRVAVQEDALTLCRLHLNIVSKRTAYHAPRTTFVTLLVFTAHVSPRSVVQVAVVHGVALLATHMLSGTPDISIRSRLFPTHTARCGWSFRLRCFHLCCFHLGYLFVKNNIPQSLHSVASTATPRVI